MTYILWGLFFISLWASQVCVCSDDLQAFGGFSSFSIADFSLFFLFLRLCFPRKASSPDLILGFSKLKREYNRFSATRSCANDYTPLPLSQLITLLRISSRIIEKAFLAFPAPKLAAYICAWVLCPLLLQKALITPVHTHLHPWYPGPQPRPPTQGLWYSNDCPPHAIIASLSLEP